MENKESVIKKLEEFKDLLNIWKYGNQQQKQEVKLIDVFLLFGNLC